ncbi:MAG: GNAT family N-acetyltransferase [Candidatus Edwardsbacteria bacterium]|nr:GNAT family N-acetyltransferase [Candidatus Edwardsbacteria bacterium]MBU1575816.1 GNAT family N-acetyltransferase [Candidatus Edwardsbacteria bacterium]MBU2593277.1 GNAT family N-acetyltransferase [Candidatus Edwardsbacteria bacterium]
MLNHIRLNEVSERQFLAFSATYRRHDEDRHQLKDGQTFREYIAALNRYEDPDNLPPGKVTQISFWFLNEDNVLIGNSRLRLSLNEYLLNIGGHIGFDVSPEHRRKGYATEILRLTLNEARKNGTHRVLVTCNEGNLPSRKVIENNGGILENIVIEDSTEKNILRFWINLNECGK